MATVERMPCPSCDGMHAGTPGTVLVCECGERIVAREVFHFHSAFPHGWFWLKQTAEQARRKRGL